MKVLKHLPGCSLCLVFLVGCLWSGCKRDIPPLPSDELRDVTFKLSGFEAEAMPLDGPQATTPMALNTRGMGMRALRNIQPSLEPQYLYYWSFNEENLDPFIAVDEVEAGITFVGKDLDYVTGFGLAPVEAGKALSITGAQSVEMNLPMRGVESVTTFDFDISSSATGPKDFSFSCSVDGGTTYEVLSATNSFGESSRDRYAFDLSGLQPFSGIETLMLKFDFLPGDRGEGSDYNENTGTVKLDNMRLSGVYNAASGDDSTVPGTLHYYIFSSEDGSVVQHQELAMSALGDDGSLDVQLADGNYDVLFVAYRSDKEVLLPENLTNANEFYFGQHFDDYRAVTYAALLEDVVVGEAEVEEAATLSRCYSLVEFDFTDLAADLQRVEKIVVTRAHDNFLYTPFGLPAEVQLSDAQAIEFSGFDNLEDYQIALHQFFGLLDGLGGVSYELVAYGEGGVVLNTVTITHDIRNNVRLRLTGKLLGNSGAINGFSLAIDTDWRETLDYAF